MTKLLTGIVTAIQRNPKIRGPFRPLISLSETRRLEENVKVCNFSSFLCT